MDTYSSSEDLLIKTRKPYTISKQRERWTEEEHNRFLEALKLYGRAWQRIEEHIGTKTAVQIRSHAQKFFTKLEKEALVKGVPVNQALNIDIPPPRPKRKPSNPYPRKTGSGASSPKQLVDLDKETSPEKPDGDETLEQNCKDSQNEKDCSEVLNLFQGASCSSLSSANRNSTSRTFREFVPIRKMVIHDGTSNTLNLEKADASPEKSSQSQKRNEIDQNENNCGEFSSNDLQTTQNYPRHAPVHVINASLGMNTQNNPLNTPYQEKIPNRMEGNHNGHHPKPNFSYTEAAPESSNTRHFDPFHSIQDNHYQAYLQASSVFSGFILSSLLKNPAAHATASFAASFSPFSNMEAIAAATVAAATAWWTTHGLIPLNNGFNINPDASTTVNPSTASAAINIVDKKENEFSLQDQQQQLQPEFSEATQAQKQSALELPTLSSSDSEKNEGANQNAVGASASPNNEEAKNTKGVKLVDRSSCGSNTPSSSEVETDALKKDALEKAEEVEEDDLREEQPENINCDFNNFRGGRSPYITSDSWKAVSEEGRLAFQALFSREKLPQSFWPPTDIRNMGNQINSMETDQQNNENEKIEDAIELDLNNNNMWESCCPSNQLTEGNYTSLRSESNNEKLLEWKIEIGQGKLKARGTGFKPYKRLRFS